MSRADPTPHRSLPAAALLLLVVIAPRVSLAAPPSIAPIPDQIVLEGWSITYQVMASDPDGNPLMYFVSGPAWVSISSTGLLTMAPPGGAAAPGGSLLGATVIVSDGTTPVSDGFDIRLLDARADQTEHGGGVVYSMKSWSPVGVNGEGDSFHSTSDGTKQQMVSGKQAIIGGLLGVDNEHGDTDRPIVHARIYNSRLERDQVQHGHLGRNWLGIYDWRIEINGPIADVTTNRGGKIRFQSQGPATWMLASPLDVPYRLAQSGSQYLFHDALTGWVERFDGTTGRLLSCENTHGYVLTMAYTGSLLSSVSDPFGRALTFTYDRSNRLIQLSDGTRTMSYSYDAAGNLSTFTDAGGGLTQYLYAAGSPAGLLLGVIEPEGNSPWTLSYGSQGEVLSIVDAAANTTALSYTRDPSGRVTMVQLVRPVPGGFTYRTDLDGHCFEMTDPSGGVTSRAFDATGRLTRLTRPLMDVTSFSYDPANGHLASIGFPDATSVGFTYSSRTYAGALTLYQTSSVSRPDGTSVGYAYDAAGNMSTMIDPGSFTWSWTYNAFGKPLTFHNPAGGSTSYTYDGVGRLQTWTDHFGNATTYAYDALDRLIQVTDPGAPARTYDYDAMDRLLSATNEIGKTWGYQYDSNGRLLQITNPLSGQTDFTWNAMDRLTQSETPLGGQTSFTHDAIGRVTGVTDPTSRSTTFEYDDVGRVYRVRDGAGQATTYTYDANGRLTHRADPLAHTTHYAYDAVDRVIGITDPASTAFSMTYDAMDRLQTVTGPLGYSRDYDYDSRGNVTRSEFGGVAEQYARNALGAIGSILDRNGQTWSYGYDQEGRLTSRTDPLSRTTQYTYDPRWNVGQITMPVGSVSFGFDAANRLTQRSYSDGTVIPYTYDDLNRLLTTTSASFAYDADGRVTASTGGIGYGYDAAGRLLSLTYASGKTVGYTYDSRGNLTSVVDWIGGTTGFTYDAAGRRTRLARPDGSLTSYVYDPADRLIRLTDVRTDSTAAISLAYDALGRVTSATRKQPLQLSFKNENASYSYDAAGQIVGYTYDGVGRLVSDGTRSYEWDVASRLKTATGAAGPLRFEYDGLGRVTRRTLGAKVEDDVHASFPSPPRNPLWGIEANHPGTATHGKSGLSWWWGSLHGPGDGWYRSKPHVAPEVHPTWALAIHVKDDPFLNRPIRSSSPMVNYVYTPAGELLHSVDDASAARRFYHFDERGNTIFLSRDAGSVVTSYAYSIQGSSVDELGLGTSHLARYTYAGQIGSLEESAVGLLYRGASGSIYDGRTSRGILPVPGPHGSIGGVDYTITGHQGELDDVKDTGTASVFLVTIGEPANTTDPPFRIKAKVTEVILDSSLPWGTYAPSGDNWAIFARNWGNEGSGMQLYFTGKLRPAGAPNHCATCQDYVGITGNIVTPAAYSPMQPVEFYYTGTKKQLPGTPRPSTKFILLDYPGHVVDHPDFLWLPQAGP